MPDRHATIEAITTGDRLLTGFLQDGTRRCPVAAPRGEIGSRGPKDSTRHSSTLQASTNPLNPARPPAPPVDFRFM